MNATFEKTMKEIQRVEAKLAAQKGNFRRQAIAEVNNVIALFSIKSDELNFNGQVRAPRLKDARDKKVRSRQNVKPKYRAPDGTLRNGRGRTPRAMQKFIDEGMTLEQMRIREESA